MSRESISSVRTGGDFDLAFAVVVLASFFATFSSLREASPLQIVLLISLGTAYLAIGIYGYAYSSRSNSELTKSIYFALQIPLGAMIVYLGKGAGFNAMVLLPLAGHAVVLLPRRMGYAAHFFIVAAYVAAVYSFGGGFQTVWEGLPIFVAGLIFIVVFTQMALNEAASRREVERLVGELTVANQQLREYAIQIEDLATIKERNRLAREIHDGLGHYLTTIHMQLQAANAVTSRDQHRATEIIHKAQALTQAALEDVRQSVAALQSKTNEQKTLNELISNLLDSARMFQIEPVFKTLGQQRDLAVPARWMLFRAAQEGVSNTCKHAKAKHLWITLDYSDLNLIRLEVKDDGQGVNNIGAGFGLTGLKERVHLLDGTFEIITEIDKGFSFEITIPG